MRSERLTLALLAACALVLTAAVGSASGPSGPANMVFMAPGTFTMGSPASEVGRDSDEGPQTVVTIRQGFWLDRHEVSHREYLAVMGTPPPFPGSDLDWPASVTWNDAVDYCAKLTAREQAAGRLPAGYEYWLPTEAQWEYACRAGTTTATAFGDMLSSTQANFNGDYPYNGGAPAPTLGRKAKVGSYAPNAWGLYDMEGNVWEWCADWYGTYPGGGVADPQGPSSGAYRAYRGGGFYYSGRYCRSASRDWGYPWRWHPAVGFRAALVTLPQPSPTALVTWDLCAQIDGRSRLALRANTAQWSHFEGAAPGYRSDPPEPTRFSTWDRSNAVMVSYAWLPVFSSGVSDLAPTLSPPLPPISNVTVTSLAGHGVTAVVQWPSPNNGYTTIIEFDDEPLDSYGYYRVRIEASGRLPGIVQQPTSVVVGLGGEAVFTVLADGTEPLTYQWWFDGRVLPGATGPTLKIEDAQPQHAGHYLVTVENYFGKASSDVVALAVHGAPVILRQPGGVTAHAGSRVTLEVVAIGAAPLTYQWYFNGRILPEATTPTLVLPAAQPTQEGQYQVQVFNALGSATSEAAKLTVILALSNLIRTETSFSASVGTTAGKTYTLECKRTLNDPAWSQAATVSGDGTTQTLTDSSATSEQGFYRVRVE